MGTHASALRPTDPRSLGLALLYGLGGGGLALVDPDRLSPAGLRTLRIASAVAAGTAVALELSAEDNDMAWQAGQTALAPAALSVGAAGLVFGLAEVSEAWDRQVVRALASAGVSRPRLLLAIGTAAVSLGAFALGRKLAPPEEPADEEAPRLEAVPTDVRDLVLGMLASTDGHSADVLRAQLDSAQVRIWPSDDEDSWSTELTVVGDPPLAVPHSFTFPVKAQFTSTGGQRLQVMLLVEDGLLDSLILDTVSEDGWDQEPWPPDSLDRWPTLDEVTFVHDSTER